ncbi:MAG: UDP-N-acetylmuramate--L-alanine ligase [Saprospiraceae bacterium]|nr:UDP-N-acetylmuramate--L-alanine ligase [Saprospiraceae bacterium]
MDDLKRIYFLGIGGIGMSALARYFHKRGVEVFGYDKIRTELTQSLEAEGMEIHYDDDPSRIPHDVDVVVLTPAIPNENLEKKWLVKSGIPIKKRAEMLGLISRNKKTVAIAGTHGKTTTSSITAHLLRTGGIECSAFLGGIAANFNSNFIDGDSDWVVVEADEYDRSFLHLHPDIAAVLSMDADHLDIYGTADEILAGGYLAFLKQVKAGGEIIINNDFADLVEIEGIDTIGFGQGDLKISNVTVSEGRMVFDFDNGNKQLQGLRFPLPGRHNVFNASIAVAIALKLGISEEKIREGLESFKGIKRRFEILARTDEVAYIDDYAHHPTELEAAIDAARIFFPGKKLTGIFQPHLFSRTRDFADEFAAALDKLDEILLLEIYPAREKPIEGVTSKMLLDKMKNAAKRIITKADVPEYLQGKDLEVVMTLGAGDIDTLRTPVKNVIVEKYYK